MQIKLATVVPFIPFTQWAYIKSVAYSDFFQKKLAEFTDRIENMPVSHETDGQGDAAVAHLHYFVGASHWYIIEKDDTPNYPFGQAFGFAILNGDLQNAELGYISIDELRHCLSIELDLDFTPASIEAIKKQHGI